MIDMYNDISGSIADQPPQRLRRQDDELLSNLSQIIVIISSAVSLFGPNITALATFTPVCTSTLTDLLP